MSSSNPWGTIKTPTADDYISTRLVEGFESSGRVSVFWAKTSEGHNALLIKYPYLSKDDTLPAMRAIRISKMADEQSKARSILIELTEDGILQPFMKLCEDIIDAVTKAVPHEVCSHVRIRLEIWRYMLSLSSGKLGKHEQKGLIAELRFLREVCFKAMPANEAVKAWTGPLGSPRDFSFGRLYVEVKSNRRSANSKVKISSESQLAAKPPEELYLCVLGLDEAPSGGISLADEVRKTKEAIGDDYLATEELSLRLAAVGYSDDVDYSTITWDITGKDSYLVSDGFPRITPADLPSGVSEVKYSLGLSKCDAFKVELSSVERAIGEYNGRTI